MNLIGSEFSNPKSPIKKFYKRVTSNTPASKARLRSADHHFHKTFKNQKISVKTDSYPAFRSINSEINSLHFNNMIVNPMVLFI